MYAAVAVAISWPLAWNFTTVLTGTGLDALSHLWGVWHSIQAMAGREPLFSTTLLYYPAGASLLLHSAGPFLGVLALPFWPLGAVAAYNGSLLFGLILTGCAMYVLARDIGCSRSAAVFAGLVLLSAPIHLVGLRGHAEKVFLGFIPVAFLALRRCLDSRRYVVWAAAFGAVLLLLLLHSPFQFVQVALASPLFVIAAAAGHGDRRAIATRAAAAAVAAAVMAGPLLMAISRAADDPAMAIERRAESPSHQADLVQFVFPPTFSRWFGPWTTTMLERWNVTASIETEVAIPWIAIFLIGAALATRWRSASLWAALALASIILALGPRLQAFGQDTAIALPYPWLTSLPGLNFLRTPPRFMQAGFVGIAAAAGLGLAALGSRMPRVSAALAPAAAVAMLVEIWPAAWPVQAMRPTPDIYQRLATDAEAYGVLDLPLRPLPEVSPVDYSARYQVHQMTHRKGIAAGYVARTYGRHPISPCLFAEDRAPRDIRVDGEPSRCEPAAIHQLASHGYRYVVWHVPSDKTGDNRPGSWAAEDAQTFVKAAFGSRPPAIEDELVRVWALPPVEQSLPPKPVMELANGWHPAEPLWRWTSSPAVVRLTAPAAAHATLEIDIALLHGAQGQALGDESVLVVAFGGHTLSVPIRSGETVRVPLDVAAGTEDLTLTLGAGNFRPSDFGEADPRLLSFAIARMDLVTGGIAHP